MVEPFFLDRARLQQLASQHWLTCRTCGERLSCGNFEALVQHMLSHETNPKTRRTLTTLLLDLKRRPEEYLALALRELASDPARLERLRREGLFVSVPGNG